MTGKRAWWGAGIPLAIEMAFEDINKRDDILRDYELKLISRDTQGDTGRGNKVFYNFLNEGKVRLILGPSRSNVAESAGATAKYYNMIQVSPSAASGELSKKDVFPYFFRTVPALSAANRTFIAIAKTFAWTRVAILYQSRELFTSAATSLREECKKNGIEVISYGSFLMDPKNQIKHLKDIDARIIFGFFSYSTRTMCETPEEFKSSFIQKARKSDITDTSYKGFAYDAAWLVALALNRTAQNLAPTIPLDTVAFGDRNFSDLMKKNLLSTEFQGVTSFLKLNDKGDRSGVFEISQLRGAEFEAICSHDVGRTSLNFYPDKDFRWEGEQKGTYRAKFSLKMLSIECKQNDRYVRQNAAQDYHIVQNNHEDDNILQLPYTYTCEVNRIEIWLGLLYSYKGILLLFGLFLAWETRNVKIPALNDSHHIGMAVYNVVIVCIVGTPVVTFVHEEQFEASFIVTGICILFSTTSTLCIVFVPKIAALRKNGLNEEYRARTRTFSSLDTFTVTTAKRSCSGKDTINKDGELQRLREMLDMWYGLPAGANIAEMSVLFEFYSQLQREKKRISHSNGTSMTTQL
ncbi:hypothetical protein pdam_00004029 [Pocillopora damicornis]|uniref:G-protein coupled receptors family 3 profile domain-containing protein n=1 Tax=Pocillopora damicornis TaxID=46731 RepID=A0A3M6TEF1_POCDA|nr:hypothetical protein pdam_00004029 [Pocillopora damicornis]